MRCSRSRSPSGLLQPAVVTKVAATGADRAHPLRRQCGDPLGRNVVGAARRARRRRRGTAQGRRCAGGGRCGPRGHRPARHRAAGPVAAGAVGAGGARSGRRRHRLAGGRIRFLSQQVQSRDAGAAAARLRLQAVPVFRGAGKRLHARHGDPRHAAGAGSQRRPGRELAAGEFQQGLRRTNAAARGPGALAQPGFDPRAAKRGPGCGAGACGEVRLQDRSHSPGRCHWPWARRWYRRWRWPPVSPCSPTAASRWIRTTSAASRIPPARCCTRPNRSWPARRASRRRATRCWRRRPRPRSTLPMEVAQGRTLPTPAASPQKCSRAARIRR